MPRVPMILVLTVMLFFAAGAWAQESPAPASHGTDDPNAALGLPRIVNQIAPSVVQVLPMQGANSEEPSIERRGSGIAVVEGIITSDQVVGDADQVVVVAHDGRRGIATVTRRAPGHDLVLLEMDLLLPPADIEAASDQRIGEMVLVVGYPRPDVLGDASLTLTHGVISAIRQDQESVTYLQTDAPMDPGVSGGAVVNLRGHVVGVPSFDLQRGTGPGLNFAVGGEEVRALLQQASSPAAPVVTYDGNPRDLLPSPADVGFAWKAAPIPPDGASGYAPTEAAAATASELLVRGDPNIPSGPFAELWPAVMLTQDAEHARWTWERALRHPPRGFVRLPDPTIQSTCHAYQRTGDSVTDVQVLCQEANVVVGILLSGTPELVTPDVVTLAADLMTRRIREHGS
jgi:S1-C subfamily serine protease